jgi:hypothetical protein
MLVFDSATSAQLRPQQQNRLRVTVCLQVSRAEIGHVDILAHAMAEMGISMVPGHLILGLVRNRRCVRKLRSALEYFPIPSKSPRLPLPPRPFLNVHKMRVDSDNKR